MTIKKAWLSPWATHSELFTLSLESESPEREHARIQAEERLFPNKPSPEHPLRHVICIGLLDLDDLLKLRSAIDEFIQARS